MFIPVLGYPDTLAFSAFNCLCCTHFLIFFHFHSNCPSLRPGIVATGQRLATGSNNNNDNTTNRRGPPPGFYPRQISSDEYREFGRRPYDPWEMFEEGFRAGTPGANHRFPMQSFSPIQLIRDDDDFFLPGEMMGQTLQGLMAASPMFFGNGRFSGEPAGGDNSLTDAEFQTVMSKLEKEKYMPKRRSGKGRSRCTQDEDVCPICLDGFAAKQELLCLPCSHRFHSGCLTPWIKGHGQCPLCRLDLTGRARARGNSANPYSASSDVSTNNIVSFVRAVEQAVDRMVMNP